MTFIKRKFLTEIRPKPVILQASNTDFRRLRNCVTGQTEELKTELQREAIPGHPTEVTLSFNCPLAAGLCRPIVAHVHTSNGQPSEPTEGCQDPELRRLKCRRPHGIRWSRTNKDIILHNGQGLNLNALLDVEPAQSIQRFRMLFPGSFW